MDFKYFIFIVWVKGGDGIWIYKRNWMIMINFIVIGKDFIFDIIIYEWVFFGVI